MRGWGGGAECGDKLAARPAAKNNINLFTRSGSAPESTENSAIPRAFASAMRLLISRENIGEAAILMIRPPFTISGKAVLVHNNERRKFASSVLDHSSGSICQSETGNRAISTTFTTIVMKPR